MNDNYIGQQKKSIEHLKSDIAKGQTKATVVKMRKDYEKDEEISLTSVVFMPSDLNQIITEKIIEPLKRIEADHHYYYTSESLHLTIKNIRAVHKPPLFGVKDIAKVNQFFKK